MSVGTNRFGRASGLLVLCLLASACCAGDSSPPPRNPPAGGDVKEKGAAEGEGKGDGDAAIHAEPKGGTMAFTLQSSAFKEGDPIPAKYTGDGPDVSPALSWSDPPAGTRSFCLIADDPDAPVGLWSHWTLWNLPDSLGPCPKGWRSPRRDRAARARG